MEHPITRIVLFGLAAIGFCFSVACADTAKHNSPPELSPFPHGTDVRYEQRGNVWQVRYDVKLKHPADTLIGFILDQMRNKGWTPLPEDVFNPGIPSSHVRGWQNFTDARTSPKTQVSQWLAQWKNVSGDVVWYVLQFRSPAGKRDLTDTVHVVGSFYPSEVVKQQLEWIDNEKKKSGK